MKPGGFCPGPGGHGGGEEAANPRPNRLGLGDPDEMVLRGGTLDKGWGTEWRTSQQVSPDRISWTAAELKATCARGKESNASPIPVNERCSRQSLLASCK